MQASKNANVRLHLSGWTASGHDEDHGAETVIGRIFAKLLRIRPTPDRRDEGTLPWLGEVQVVFHPDSEGTSYLEFRVYPPDEEGDYSTEAEADDNEGEIGVPDPIATVKVYPDGRIEH